MSYVLFIVCIGLIGVFTGYGVYGYSHPMLRGVGLLFVILLITMPILTIKYEYYLTKGLRAPSLQTYDREHLRKRVHEVGSS